jgi:hypothetical protein
MVGTMLCVLALDMVLVVEVQLVVLLATVVYREAH